MTTSQKILQKKCCFYASDFHLEMTIVPFINKKIEENKKIIIVTENNLEESVKILISKINIKNKERILNLAWNNNNIDIKKNLKNAVIIVNGSKNFVSNINKQIESVLTEKNSMIEIINCYLFDEVKEEMHILVDEHEGVLNNLQKSIEKKQ